MIVFRALLSECIIAAFGLLVTLPIAWCYGRPGNKVIPLLEIAVIIATTTQLKPK